MIGEKLMRIAGTLAERWRDPETGLITTRCCENHQRYLFVRHFAEHLRMAHPEVEEAGRVRVFR